ncbi:NAD(P)-dependent alcohol dehydrogenase [Aureimonas sp. AU12]|uniref:NAD(P)-dependent alcohol dehydrogenase n=1 Tax=Aureimonas sp. AU12 TaxID=1638161 RepID=UPI0007812B2F|nr:NAD(P)-dependent alcohol dehydrogenase [Aureimonas sp. AU12]
MTPSFGFACTDASAPMKPWSFERRDLRDDDVLIDITHCGVCHSDIHQARNDWGWATYPLVPGHEIVGRVSAVGSKVSGFKVGDKVGVGCMVDSCQDCPSCTEGLEQYCEKGMTQTYADTDKRDGIPTYGGYSDKIVVTEKFVLRMPEKLDLAAAAPLLCAGITTYSPLKHVKLAKGDKLAVVGLGGLGHMAIKFGVAMGAEVTLFTRSKTKEAEARALGVSDVIFSTDEAAMQAAAGRFDYILDTVPVPHDLNPYIGTLKRDGTHIIVGVIGPLDPPVSGANLIIGRKSVIGSLIGGIKETQEMLDFCAEHGIVCDIEMIKMADINEAFDRTVKGDVHYRFVIDMASLAETKQAA